MTTAYCLNCAMIKWKVVTPQFKTSFGENTKVGSKQSKIMKMCAMLCIILKFEILTISKLKV